MGRSSRLSPPARFAACSGALLVGLALFGVGCAPSSRCGERAACDDDEICEEGACVAAAAAGDVRVASFAASPAEIAAGESATLSWKTRNAAHCELSPGIGRVPRSGELEVRPDTTTTWTLRCDGRSGPATAEATVRVGDDGQRDGGDEPDASLPDGGPSEGGPSEGEPGRDEPLIEGDVELLPSPPTALSGVESEGSAVLFRERAGVALDTWVMSDLTFPASYGAGEELSHTEPGVQLVPGHVLDSWLLFVGSPSDTPIEGTLTFADEIVALSFSSAKLAEGDPHFAAPETSYETLGPREWPLSRDASLELSSDRRTLRFQTAGSTRDQLRILVDASGGERPLVQSWTLFVHREGALDLNLDQYEPQNHGVIVKEGEHMLPAALGVDVKAPGHYTGGSAEPAGGLLPADQRVRSWLIHHDPSPEDTSVGPFVAVVSFPRPILGLIFTNALLASSDDVFALSEVTYPVGYVYRGIELELGDEVWWAPDGRSVRLQLERTAGDAGLDQMRVITEP